MPGERKCSRRSCLEIATVRHGKRQYFCDRCYKITKMLDGAHQRYPHLSLSWDEVDKLLKKVEPGMKCPQCEGEMRLRSHDGKRGNVITLQHWGDSQVGILCHFCNNRHGHSALGDSVFIVEHGKRYCPRCSSIKDESDFYQNKVRSSGFNSYCKSCDNKATMMRHENRRKKEVYLASGR